ncbi:MAG: cytochrome b/b6 domain-containing protein [Pseudomonadota bacterium]
MPDPDNSGYRAFSVVLHWLSALLLVAMFVTHSGGEYSLLLKFHKTIGPAVGVLLLCRVLYRIRLGFPKDSTTHPRSTLDKVVIRLLLLAIVLMVVTGCLLPWARGTSLLLAGIAIPVPPFISPLYQHTVLITHTLSAYLLVPLLLLHIMLTTRPERMFSVDSQGR